MLRRDFRRYGMRISRIFLAWLSGHAFFVVLNYRIANWLYRHHIKLLPEIIKFRTMRRYGCEISPYAKIGAGFLILHSVGIVIGHEVIIGENCEIFQNVTIGSNRKKKNNRYMPTIGNNVSIGTGAIIVGSIHIGNNVVIGANSYVDKDIPDNALVIGTPARIVRLL